MLQKTSRNSTLAELNGLSSVSGEHTYLVCGVHGCPLASHSYGSVSCSSISTAFEVSACSGNLSLRRFKWSAAG
eukprot:15366503-Alexandrium_andersonii.AAC.1